MNKGITLAEILISLLCIIVVSALITPTILKNKEQVSEVDNFKSTSFEQKQAKEEQIKGLHSMKVDYPEGSYRIFTMWNGDGIFVISLDKDKQ